MLTCLAICDNIWHISRTSRVNVPLPDDLLADIRQHPEAYGVDQLTSEASRLQRIFEEGAEAVRRRVEEAVMARVYDEWASDTEREEAIAGVADLLFVEGGELDSMLRRSQTPAT